MVSQPFPVIISLKCIFHIIHSYRLFSLKQIFRKLTCIENSSHVMQSSPLFSLNKFCNKISCNYWNSGKLFWKSPIVLLNTFLLDNYRSNSLISVIYPPIDSFGKFYNGCLFVFLWNDYGNLFHSVSPFLCLCLESRPCFLGIGANTNNSLLFCACLRQSEY